MCELPQGTHLLYRPEPQAQAYPVLRCENVYMLPGIFLYFPPPLVKISFCIISLLFHCFFPLVFAALSFSRTSGFFFFFFQILFSFFFPASFVVGHDPLSKHCVLFF